tara:strand:+ start:330 stop:701 length:372 start_codon:yes stop_codon:yes gene_type:complete
LSVKLKQCIHVVVNFQSQITQEWYKTRLIPEAVKLSKSSDSTELVVDELISVISMAISERLLTANGAVDGTDDNYQVIKDLIFSKIYPAGTKGGDSNASAGIQLFCGAALVLIFAVFVGTQYQ